MDQASVDINVLFPTHVSSYCALRDLGFENALYRAYSPPGRRFLAGAADDPMNER
jgi:hypothetical protein